MKQIHSFPPDVFEASVLPNAHGVRLTGQLGSVMRESARAAQTYVRAHGRDLSLDPNVFRSQVEFVLAERIEDVLAAALPDLARRFPVKAVA